MSQESLYSDKRSSYYEHSRPELLPFVPSNVKRALDVGCGRGNFGALLKKKLHCIVWGIEPDIESANFAKTCIDKVINAQFDSEINEISNEKFDCIFFNDVLEHLIEPNFALQKAKQYLNIDGYVVASIPNIRWYPVILGLLRYKDFKYENAGVMDKTHLRFFTKKSMIRLFEDSGFKVEKIEGINKHNSFKKFNLINFLLLRSLEDMKFPQFVIVAKVN